MSSKSNLRSLLMTIGAAAALTACGGADEVASPGIGAFPPPTTPPPAAGPDPDPDPPPAAGPPAGCPENFVNVGLITAAGNVSLRNCQFPPLVTGGLVVSKVDGVIYSVSGRVDVGQDRGGDATAPVAGAAQGVLTLEAGVRIFGSAGLDYIVVNRGSQLNVQGTSTDPVVMTSRQSIEGTTGIDSIGQWGGLVILGRAPISNCPGSILPGTPGCEAQVEGTNAFYGGNNPEDNSGSIRYLRLMHSGFQILPNNELNGITLAGVGAGTTFEYVQVHNSSDDGIEWFGGTVNARYLVLTGNDDDSMDMDVGFNGAVQFAIVQQRANGGDRMNEMSGSTRTPPTNAKLANLTMIGRAGGGAAIVLNSGSSQQYYNTIVTRAPGGTGAGSACLDVDDATTTAVFESVYFSCPTAFDDDGNAAAATAFDAGTNNTANGIPTLADGFVNGPNESAVLPYATLPAVSPFLTQVDYIGAVRDAGDTWWQGWTCGLTAASPCQ